MDPQSRNYLYLTRAAQRQLLVVEMVKTAGCKKKNRVGPFNQNKKTLELY